MLVLILVEIEVSVWVSVSVMVSYSVLVTVRVTVGVPGFWVGRLVVTVEGWRVIWPRTELRCVSDDDR